MTIMLAYTRKYSSRGGVFFYVLRSSYFSQTVRLPFTTAKIMYYINTKTFIPQTRECAIKRLKHTDGVYL